MTYPEIVKLHSELVVAKLPIPPPISRQTWCALTRKRRKKWGRQIEKNYGLFVFNAAGIMVHGYFPVIYRRVKPIAEYNIPV